MLYIVKWRLLEIKIMTFIKGLRLRRVCLRKKKRSTKSQKKKKRPGKKSQKKRRRSKKDIVRRSVSQFKGKLRRKKTSLKKLILSNKPQKLITPLKPLDREGDQ
jgi:hypothetical protein